MVVKATRQWVCFDVPVELDGKAKTKRMYMVACMKPTCFIIYVYNSRDGTSSMSAHTCSRVALAASFGNLNAWATKKGVSTDHAKANMTNSLVNMCAYDIRSFMVVEGPRFHDVIQTALGIDFASKAPLLADDLLQSRQTIKCRTMDCSEKGIAHNHFQDNGRASLSTDIWTDDATQTAYNADTMHLIDVNFIMHARVVSCDEFSEGTTHTATTIHCDFFNSVRSFITWKEENVTVQATD
jgi:hypothetical protein